MKIKKQLVSVGDVKIITSLYHSPFDYNLLFLILFAKTNIKLKIILDDIDNIGVDRSNPDSKFEYKDKYFLSKTGRTNLRSLTLTLPKHIFLNLAYPDIKALDKEIPISKLKDLLNYQDTVEHWIKDTTKKMGVYSLIGPDKAFAFMEVDSDFIRAINRAKEHLKKLASKFITKNDAVNFIDWLFSDIKSMKGRKISDYYVSILNKIIQKFELTENVSIEKMSDKINQDNNKKLLSFFGKDNNKIQTVYNNVINYLNKPHDDLPFYAISKKDGRRMLHVENHLRDSDKYILAPKVLMLNNFENLILPNHASDNINVVAREMMYKIDTINCSQVFCNEKWINHIVQFNLKLKLDDEEKRFYKKDHLEFNELFSINFSDKNDGVSIYKNWVVESTINSINKGFYPLLFLALLQDKIFYKRPPELYKININ